MFTGPSKYLSFLLLFVCGSLMPTVVFARAPQGTGQIGRTPNSPSSSSGAIDLNILVQGPDGAPIEGMALVTLSTMKAGAYQQATAVAGRVQFRGLVPSRYTVQVIASGFEREVKELDAAGMGTTMVIIELRRSSNGSADAAAATPKFPILAPRAQKELGKALEALQANKPAEAKSHLDAAQRLAPNHPEVSYLSAIYWVQSSDRTKAKTQLAQTLNFFPSHVGALLLLGEVLLDENKPDEALECLNRAVEAQPSSWRAHAILADAYERKGSPDEAIEHAELALELSHGQAIRVQPLLARALVDRGDTDRAKSVLQIYLQDHPGDEAAKKQLERLQTPQIPSSSNNTGVTPAEVKTLNTAEVATSLPPASFWLPPNVDERVPPVEPGAVCALDEVVRQAGKQIQEFVSNVDRFTATESLVHESIDKWGLASTPEKRKFDYLVSVAEVPTGLLNVKEYRNSGPVPSEFPEGVITNGLPALILIFHPRNVASFDLNCEGLARWNDGLAWQVHFRQRTDKPNTMRRYKMGLDGPSYPVSLKGRAWIAADTYQIVRLETDLTTPVPEIHLATDHTAIEYGPVKFHERNVDMWLPQNAEVYYDWRGRRIHRRHTFTNYLLFSVDDKQRISAPKSETELRPSSSAESAKPNL